TILFLSTKKHTRDIVKEAAIKCGMPYIVNKWKGGFLTNFPEIKKKMRELLNLNSFLIKDNFKNLVKKEQASLEKRRNKLQGIYEGVVNLYQKPDALFIVGLNKEKTAFKEAKKMGVAVIAVCNTNCNPRSVDYVIPGNDESANIINYDISGAFLIGRASGKSSLPVKKEPAPNQPRDNPPPTPNNPPHKPNSPTNLNELQIKVYYHSKLGRNHIELTKKGHNYTITFSPKDAEKYPNTHDQVYYFSKNNNKFTLKPYQKEPEKTGKTEIKVRYCGKAINEKGEFSDYAFVNLPKDEVKVLYISKNHPRIKELLKAGKLQPDKHFIIRYGKVDREFMRGFAHDFDEFNQDLIILAVSLGVGIFLVGRKTAKSAKNSKNKEQKAQNEKEIEKVQTKLQQVKSQLAAENNPVEKQKLQTEIDNLNQKLTKLKKGNNPTTPPIQSPPTNKTHRQLTVRCNGTVGGKWEYINLSNYQERILIDPKNKIFSSDNALYIKDIQYAISFNEEDAEKKGNNFIFDEKNNNFQLTPVNIPSPQPNSDQVEMEIRFVSAVGDDVMLSNNLKAGD
ncbi:4089_t:CDS:2, partial [Ambispora leptoticha]